jgi:hypothetical protein
MNIGLAKRSMRVGDRRGEILLPTTGTICQSSFNDPPVPNWAVSRQKHIRLEVPIRMTVSICTTTRQSTGEIRNPNETLHRSVGLRRVRGRRSKNDYDNFPERGMSDMTERRHNCHFEGKNRHQVASGHHSKVLYICLLRPAGGGTDYGIVFGDGAFGAVDADAPGGSNPQHRPVPHRRRAPGLYDRIRGLHGTVVPVHVRAGRECHGVRRTEPDGDRPRGHSPPGGGILPKGLRRPDRRLRRVEERHGALLGRERCGQVGRLLDRPWRPVLVRRRRDDRAGPADQSALEGPNDGSPHPGPDEAPDAIPDHIPGDRLPQGYDDGPHEALHDEEEEVTESRLKRWLAGARALQGPERAQRTHSSSSSGHNVSKYRIARHSAVPVFVLRARRRSWHFRELGRGGKARRGAIGQSGPKAGSPEPPTHGEGARKFPVLHRRRRSRADSSGN